MADPALDVGDDLSGIGLVPAPVQLLGRKPELDDEIARQVLGLDLAALLPPEAEEGSLVIAHDDPGIGAADKIAAIARFDLTVTLLLCGSVQRSRLQRMCELE